MRHRICVAVLPGRRAARRRRRPRAAALRRHVRRFRRGSRVLRRAAVGLRRRRDRIPAARGPTRSRTFPRAARRRLSAARDEQVAAGSCGDIGESGQIRRRSASNRHPRQAVAGQHARRGPLLAGLYHRIACRQAGTNRAACSPNGTSTSPTIRCPWSAKPCSCTSRDRTTTARLGCGWRWNARPAGAHANVAFLGARLLLQELHQPRCRQPRIANRSAGVAAGQPAPRPAPRRRPVVPGCGPLVAERYGGAPPGTLPDG